MLAGAVWCPGAAASLSCCPASYLTSGSCLRCLLCVSGLLLLGGALVCNWANSGTRGRVGKLRKKRKRHVSYRLLKKEITNWTIRSSKTARVCFSCRFVGARRFKRNFRERKRSKQFCWWMPHFYKHRGYPLKCLSPKLFGKGFSYKDALGPSNDLNHQFRVALKGGAGEVAASKRKKQEQGQQDLATALTSFLHNWNETASTRRQRYSQTQEQMKQSAN